LNIIRNSHRPNFNLQGAAGSSDVWSGAGVAAPGAYGSAAAGYSASHYPGAEAYGSAFGAQYP